MDGVMHRVRQTSERGCFCETCTLSATKPPREKDRQSHLQRMLPPLLASRGHAGMFASRLLRPLLHTTNVSLRCGSEKGMHAQGRYYYDAAGSLLDGMGFVDARSL